MFAHEVKWTFPVDIVLLFSARVREFAHERIRAVGLLGPDASSKLAVTASKLVHLDFNNIDIVVQLDESLEPLALIGFVHHPLQLFLDLLHALSNGETFVDT